MGRHWSRAARVKRDASEVLATYAYVADVPRVTTGYRPVRRLTLACRGWPEGRLPDPDAFLKLFLDCCKTARLIVDDSQEWCRWERPTVGRAGRRLTTVTLEDLT